MTIPNQNTLCCNCALCGGELIGRTNDAATLEQARKQGLCIVAGRLTDGEREKPYCEACLEVLVPGISKAIHKQTA